MKDLHIIVNNEIATYQKRDGCIVCGNKHNEEEESGYQIKFTFDTTWDAHDKKIARFIWGDQFQDVEFTGDTCPVPIISGATLCEVGVYAGDLHTTTSASIECKPSILCQNATPSVENDKYYANEARKYAEEAKEAAAGATESGATFTPSVLDDGTLSWTNDKGLDNPEPVNIKGANGKTPYIKDGNWWIGETDTGVKAKGEDGKDYVLTPADKNEIAELANSIPEYVKTEAEAVIDKVISAQGNRTFTFGAISDMHYGNGSYTDGIKHACQAMKYIDERIKLDAVAVLGDYTDGYPASQYDNAISDFKDVNAVLADLRFAQNLRIQGNHDYYEGHKGEINRFIASYSEGVTWGDITGGYFYKDFDGYKIRVICVNTTETGGGDIGVSTKQYDWFANSLDLSSKADVSEWQILILSHHPLDWWSNSYVFAYILDAYKKGKTWSNDTISVDFTDKNSATLIGNIHGHIHNFLTDYIHFGNVNGGNKSDILRMATPNACYGRENQYTESVVGVSTWVEDTTYSKTIDSAEDTAFCIYVINLEACTITAICYGAGYDRNNIEYLSEAPIVNIIDTVGYTDTKRLSATSGEVRDGAENTFVTGYIELGNIGDVYRTSGTDFRQATNGYSCMCIYESNKDFSTAMTYFKNDSSIQGIDYTIDENGNLTLTLNSGFERSGGFIRLCGNGSGANLIVTKNQLIE